MAWINLKIIKIRYADLVSRVNLLSSGKIDFISGSNILMPDFDKVNSNKMPEINAIKNIKNELLNHKKKVSYCLKFI
ncbi:hypothetical protein KDD93_05430 [Campylobacter sp. faydin G-24]|uniref:Uncharacterized protein n=1 Tax=Campylobacter anatolicus TaxID=2829105 RepID=A0ABS5HIR4_9BACT|nr:hypothetical protein [Campylobacter anatolicus]MBR8464012.1 hypothetical protein [Campylobacter anatolicus]